MKQLHLKKATQRVVVKKYMLGIINTKETEHFLNNAPLTRRMLCTWYNIVAKKNLYLMQYGRSQLQAN